MQRELIQVKYRKYKFMSFIRTRRLSHRFYVKDKNGNRIDEKWAIRDVDIEVEKGSMIAILGRNGSGKSTLARHLNGLLTSTVGEVVVDGLNPGIEKDVMKVRRKVGMVFQNPDNQIVGTNLAEDVGFGLENIQMPSGEIWKKIRKVLDMTGLSGYENYSTSHLSGGQKQRLAIASSVAMSPECIIFDEATSMLDPQGADTVMELIELLNQEKKMTVIMVTHKLKEAEKADFVYVVDAGHIVFHGKPEELVSNRELLKEYGLLNPFEAEKNIRTSERSEFTSTQSGLASTQSGFASTQGGLAITQGGECSRHKETVIRIENLQFNYKKDMDENFGLHDINLTINKGEIVALVGKTGSGKSTLLQVLNRLVAPEKGKIELCGRDVLSEKNIKNIRKKIGYVFQFPESQLFESTVIKDVMYGPKNFGMSEEDAKEAAIKALNLVGLPQQYEEYSPFDLSGGMKRRVALAGILAYNPEILILDEPTAGLDGESKEKLFALLRKMRTEKECTIIFVSHDMEEVNALADRVVTMDKGRIIFDGRKDDFFKMS
jgi:energy-coupling factor transport system ATP-binding protein